MSPGRDTSNSLPLPPQVSHPLPRSRVPHLSHQRNNALPCR